jgi:hypothetical protein
VKRGADAEGSGRFLACSEAPGWKRQGVVDYLLLVEASHSPEGNGRLSSLTATTRTV